MSARLARLQHASSRLLGRARLAHATQRALMTWHARAWALKQVARLKAALTPPRVVTRSFGTQVAKPAQKRAAATFASRAWRQDFSPDWQLDGQPNPNPKGFSPDWQLDGQTEREPLQPSESS